MTYVNFQRKLCLVVLAMVLAGSLLAADAVPGSMNLFVQMYAGQRSNISGQVGFAFVPATSLSVTALGRSVGGGTLHQSHLLTLWDSTTKEVLAQVSVSPASPVDGYGFAFAPLASPAVLQQGRSYCLTSSEVSGGDPWMDIHDIRDHLAVATVGPGAYTTGSGYPESSYGADDQGYGLPTLYFDTNGIAPALLQVGNPPPTPLLRDVQAGYLLNCTFRAIRPYSWTQTPLLSGWETDSSGGGWREIPPGFFPTNFAFNVVSFWLYDTNHQYAVTIKHQIAEQTAGKVTWEFRFMLPAAMDGAAWQLRDLIQPAVSIITQNGKLCYETTNQPVTLVPLVYGHEYGIKVVADVSTRRADIYVDGQLMAQAVCFVNPVKSLDYVLIKTGDAATGNMYLPLVRVYRGYAVCETFATCATHRVPNDWQASGSAMVESFPCAAKPDIFSLKLTNGAGATKCFESDAGTNVVWEFKFLLPRKTAGVAAELLVSNSPVFSLVTAGEDISCKNAQGQLVPIVTNYLANLWYAVKVVANSQAGTARIFVNGKLAQTAASFTPPGTDFNGVRFVAGLGTMWVDDVRVHAWQGYPTNYVPQPQSVAVQGDYLLGVQSCDLWEEGDAYAGWGYIEPYAKRRTPCLGWYDDGNPEAADWQIKWEVEHGIGFELYCWYRPNDAINYPIKDGVLEQGLRDGFFNARYSHLEKFAIMYTDQGAGKTNPNDWINNIIPYWIEYFFKDPRYLKINGRPLISIYSYRDFENDFGGVAGGKQATDALRAACAQAGFPGVIILMEERNGDTNAMQQMQAMGADCCYAYTWGTGDVNSQEQDNLNQRNAAASIGFKNIPSVSVGWENAPWTGSPEGNGWASVSDYKSLAQWTKNTFMPTLPTNSLGSRMVLLANWNEFGEGAFIMPSTLAGFGYLDALREVFTGGGSGPSLVPTDAQKSRFTVLYPNTPSRRLPISAGRKPPEMSDYYSCPTKGLGSWIWEKKVLDNQICQLWKTFNIPKGESVAKAQLVMTVDNEFTLYLDGRELGRGVEWREYYLFDLTQLLTPGRHVLAVKCYNGDADAGMLFGLHIELADGRDIEVESDKSWKIVPIGVNRWEDQTKAQPDWPAATIIARLGDPAPINHSAWMPDPSKVVLMPELQPINIYFWQTSWFQIAVLLLGGLVILIVFRLLTQLAFHQNERRLLQRERARIAREIHDDIGARMTQLVLDGEEARRELADASNMQLRLTHICEEARGLLATMDEILWAVNPRRDTLRDFATYVCKYANKFFKPTQIQCRFELEPALSAAAFSLPLRRSLFMAIKESLNNAVKYSEATELCLKIQWQNERLVVVVQDNGKGFDPATVTPGRNGLTNMVQRMGEVGGRCLITSQPGKGCRVEFSIPLKRRHSWLWFGNATQFSGQMNDARNDRTNEL
jgi:hypothetical protein